MKFSFEERPYSGESIRPKPEIHFDRQSNLLIVATPWGSRDGARKAVSRMLDYLTLAQGDKEVTSPFPKLSCLSSAANNLRTAALLANDSLYRDENKSEYKVGVEIFAISCQGNECVWLQAGHPNILLSRQDSKVIPLATSLDLAFDMENENSNLLPPLPSLLLGLDSTVNLTIGSFRAKSNDKIILLSHSRLPHQIFNFKSDETNLNSISRMLAKEDSNAAFWLGLLQLKSAS